MIANAGYFDDRFFAYWEDGDFSVRSSAAGYRNAIVTCAGIRHKGTPGITRSVDYSYYMTRNSYLFWMKYLRRLSRIYYLKQYLAEVVGNFALYRHCGANDHAEAVLDGAWAAIRGINGEWDKTAKMPYLIRKIVSWHPYFWYGMLNGEFLSVAFQVSKRVKEKMLRV